MSDILKSLLRACIAAHLILTLGTSMAYVQDGDLPLKTGVTGSTPRDDRRNPVHILGFADVQRLILEIAEQPRPREYIDAVVADKRFTVDDMVRAGLLREEEGVYWIDFNLLLLADQKAIIEASEGLGRHLAQAVLAHRAEFEALAATHRQPGVGSPEVLYIVLGCFSLDWDGLAFTGGRRYRHGAQRTIEGKSFTPWAKERGAQVSLKALYWGSHNRSRTDFTFTTFGDHHSSPRFGFPDIMWNARDDFARYGDNPEGQRAARELFGSYKSDADALDDIADVMRLLRFEELSEEKLAAQTRLKPEKLGRMLNLLEAADYVERTGKKLRSRALVLTPDDVEMVRAMLVAGRTIIASWHEQNYGRIRAQLSDLTPLRNGVPFERVYTEVWHFVFGIANRVLVEEGLFADPYAESRRFKGFLPAIWAKGLDEFPEGH